MKLLDIILERWTPEKDTFNGKTVESELTGTSDNLADFLKAIDRLPDTIEYINVPINTKLFKTSEDSKKIEPNQGWKQEVKQIISNLVKQYEEKGKVVDEFLLRTYGIGAKPTDSFYIQLSTKESRKFAADMSSGKYGSLD